jgi:3-hydroxyisobutyrate dehydrogenase-like beta-hydroxyacid dehydrogenase
MNTLGMIAELVEGGIGAASSIKMVRSIMIKGLEALIAECVLAGHKAGVTDTVLASLEQTYPGFGWQDRAAYVFERMMVHGQRRAAEMREVALMVDQLGLDSAMSRASADWQQSIGELRLKAGEDSCQLRAQAILDALAARSGNGNN